MKRGVQTVCDVITPSAVYPAILVHGSLLLHGKRNDGTSYLNNFIPHTHMASSASEIIIL